MMTKDEKPGSKRLSFIYICSGTCFLPSASPSTTLRALHHWTDHHSGAPLFFPKQSNLNRRHFPSLESLETFSARGQAPGGRPGPVSKLAMICQDGLQTRLSCPPPKTTSRSRLVELCCWRNHTLRIILPPRSRLNPSTAKLSERMPAILDLMTTMGRDFVSPIGPRSKDSTSDSSDTRGRTATFLFEPKESPALQATRKKVSARGSKGGVSYSWQEQQSPISTFSRSGQSCLELGIKSRTRHGRKWGRGTSCVRLQMPTELDLNKTTLFFS